MLPVYITVLNLEILTSPVFYYTIAKNLNTYIVVNILLYKCVGKYFRSTSTK